MVCEYSDISTEYLLEKYSEFLEGDYEIMFAHIREGSEIANYAQTECQFRYCGTAIPFLTVRSTAR